MARSISPQMAKVLERLELERPLLLTSKGLAAMLYEEGIATPAPLFAARMREKGWLLPTDLRGVWEFAPAESAGAYSSMDPLLPLKSFAAAHPNLQPALTGQAAAWALGLADRAPAIIDATLPNAPAKKPVTPENLRLLTFSPALPTVEAHGVASLSPDSLFVHMAARPTQVSSWQSASEWLPDVAFELMPERIAEELRERPQSVAARTGYLLQGMRPDISAAISLAMGPVSKVRFGPRAPSRRNDERWGIADTLLPFDPRDLEDVR